MKNKTRGLVEPPAASLSANRSMLRYSRAQGYADISEHFKGLSASLNAREEDATQTEIISEEEDGKMVVKIVGPIDSLWGFDAPALIRRIERERPSKVALIITSPGGYVFETMALYHDLRALARDGVRISTEVRFAASSAAVMLALAGDRRTIAEGSSIMVHSPYLPFTLLDKVRNDQSTRNEFESILDALDAIEKQFVSIFISRTGQEQAIAEGWMDGADHWFEANEAIDQGFVHSVVKDTKEPEPGGEEPAIGSVEHINRVVAHHLGEQL